MTNIEIETKFLLPGPASLAALPAALKKVCDCVTARGSVLLHDTYLDTADWAFFRSGLACRIRRQSGSDPARSQAWLAIKELAPPIGNLSMRMELEERLTRTPGPRIDRLPGRSLARRLRSMLGCPGPGRGIRALFDIDNRRTTYRVGYGKLEADIAADAVTFRAAGRSLNLAEVELEAVNGKGPALMRLARKLARRMPATPATTSKFQTGLKLADLAPPMLATIGQLRLSPSHTAWDAARRVIGTLVDQVLWHEPGTRLGLLAEPLHEMRVALRRLRAALRVFGDCLGWRSSDSLRAELAELSRACGAVRDLDVYLANLPALAKRVGGVDRPVIQRYRHGLDRRRQRARRRLIVLLDSPAYARLIRRLRQLTQLPAVQKRKRMQETNGAKDGSGPAIDFARRAIRKRYRRMLRHGRAIHRRPSDRQLHTLRLEIKRTRYACEFLGSLFGGKMARLIARLIAMQDALGGLQDAAVAAGMLEKFASRLDHVAQPTAPSAVNVAQPPSAVNVAQPPPAVNVAQPPPAVISPPKAGEIGPAGQSMRADLSRLIRWQRRRQKRQRAEFARLWRRFDAKNPSAGLNWL